MQNVTFSNLNFSKNANIIYLKQQTLNPFILENSYFENIIGGRILLEPDTSDITTLPATLNVYNLNVANNDFKDTIIIKNGILLKFNFRRFLKSLVYLIKNLS